MNDLETLVAVVMVMAYSIGRQLVGEPLRAKRLLGLPLALTLIGVVDVAKSGGPRPTGVDIALIVAGCALNAAIGMWQGSLMRLESREGSLWGQMPTSVLWGWGCKIVTGIVLDGIAHALGAQLATISAVMLLELGVNRLAQGTTVAARGLSRGIPFAPESAVLHVGHTQSGPGKPSATSTGAGPARSPKAANNVDGLSRHAASISSSQSRQIFQLIAREMSDRVNEAMR